MKRFRGGLVFKAHRFVYHSTLDLRVIKKKNEVPRPPGIPEREFFIDNLLVPIHLIIEMILVDRPCAMGV